MSDEYSMEQNQESVDPLLNLPTDGNGNFVPMALWGPNNQPLHVHRPRNTTPNHIAQPKFPSLGGVPEGRGGKYTDGRYPETPKGRSIA